MDSEALDAECNRNNYMSLDKQIKDLTKQIKTARKTAGKALKMNITEFKNQLSAEDFVKWQDITGRIIKARLDGNDKQVDALTKDLENLING